MYLDTTNSERVKRNGGVLSCIAPQRPRMLKALTDRKMCHLKRNRSNCNNINKIKKRKDK